MALLKQSTSYTRAFLMVASTDHVAGATGKTVTVNLSKAGGSFSAAGGTITEIANGWYKIALTTTDTGTLGDLAFNCTATGCDNTDFADQVVAIDLTDSVRMGLTSLPASPMQVKKNQALSNFAFLMVSSTDHVTPKTGATITAQRSIDGGAFASCTNSAAELSNGIYTINLSAGDMNGGVITLLFSASGADARYVTIVTQA
jgi:hypothetical protein